MDGTYSNLRRPIQLTDAVHPDSRAADPEDDAALIVACRAGEMRAYGLLVRRYQDRVFNLCWRMCGNRDDAEDFTQEAFVKALQSIDRFADRSRFYTWLFRIAVNVVITARRQSGRRRTFSLEGDADSNSDGRSDSYRPALASNDPRPEDRAMQSEHQGLVLEALNGLDEGHRTVLVLRDMESLGYDEIADILSVPAGTVKSRIHRARTALRDALEPLLGMD
ncbi:MAG TPA: sigma-70 family RNA polymerase sigma factor [Phycisphaerae bacterium]|nr:sigma-70 family RNA polymerase sigma factor [Phycisphaerae bacterium]